MCTLTYRLSADGYQVFFNRDEQKTRPQAIPPACDQQLKAIYPIDPTGGGTWIAVSQQGSTLALLNYYQAQIIQPNREFISRGVIIPHLLAGQGDVESQLLKMDLSCFQAFQLCAFDGEISAKKCAAELAKKYIWDGQTLTISSIFQDEQLPITSSAVNFESVDAYRKQRFIEMISDKEATTGDYLAFHQQQNEQGSLSVKMSREDAHTVSLSQIVVDGEGSNQRISFNYLDYLAEQSDFQKNSFPS